MAGNLTTTIAKTITTQGYTPKAATSTITGVSVIPFAVSASAGAAGTAGSSTIYNDSIGSLPVVANINFLYFVSDTVDATATFYSTQNGGGSVVGQIHMTAGAPFEWDSFMGAMPSTNLSAPALSAGITAQGTVGATWNGTSWSTASATSASSGQTCNITAFIGLSS